jgi:Abortive infection alpha
MFGLERVAKALTLRSSSAPRRSSLVPSERPPLDVLARLAWGQVIALPSALRGAPELLRGLSSRLAERMLAIPAPRRRVPDPSFTVRVLSRMIRAEDDTRDAYLSLLAAASDSAFADEVHPAFLEVMNQLHRDELRILQTFDHDGPYPVVSVSSRLQHGGGSRVELRHFSLLGERAACRHPERTPAYLDNLARLGLIEIRPTRVTDDLRVFEELESHPAVMAVRATIEQRPAVRVGPVSEAIVADVNYKSLLVTSFGRQFRDVCFHRSDSLPAGAAVATRDERLAFR